MDQAAEGEEQERESTSPSITEESCLSSVHSNKRYRMTGDFSRSNVTQVTNKTESTPSIQFLRPKIKNLEMVQINNEKRGKYHKAGNITIRLGL